MNKQPPRDIDIRVKTTFLQADSAAEVSRYVYAYTIDIENNTNTRVQLISRYWLITDGNNLEQEVSGLGVVGQQPHLEPGQSYQYTSGAVLNTPNGMMQGHYTFQDDGGASFDVAIPPFALVQAASLH